MKARWGVVATLAAVLLSSTSTPALATGIELGTLASGIWTWATTTTIGAVVVQAGVGLALTAASFGIQYLVSGAGRRQGQASHEAQGVQIPEFSPMLTATLAYGEVTRAGGVFSVSHR